MATLTATASNVVHLGTLTPGSCPLCGHNPTRRSVKPPVAVDTATLTDAELFAHYKRTANLEDARFALKYDLPMSDEIRADWRALVDVAPRLPRAECLRRLRALRFRRLEWLHQTDPTPMTRAYFTRS